MKPPIIETMRSRHAFGGHPEFKDLSTWETWIVALMAGFGLGHLFDKRQLEIFKKFTGRIVPPLRRVIEFWLFCGRRAGKSFIAALQTVYLGVFHKWKVASGRVHILCLAVDRAQAAVVFHYVKEFLRLPAFQNLVEKELANSIYLKTGVVITVATCSYRSLRGYKIGAVVMDEVAFWSDAGYNPDKEIYRALLPALNEFEDSMLIGITTVYRDAGLVGDAKKNYYGVDDPKRLVWIAGTRDMNPTYSQEAIDEEMKRDPVSARSEYFSEFRPDLETYIDMTALDEVVVAGRRELPAGAQFKYSAFCDPSGGRYDSMTMSICHLEDQQIVQDVLRYRQAPFNPQHVTRDFCDTLKKYKVKSIRGDKYSAEWVVSEFAKHGITYKNSPLSKSEIYLEFLPLVTTKRVELLDIPSMVFEFRALERRTGRDRDIVDHAKGRHDDQSNSCAGACVFAERKESKGGALLWSSKDAY